MDLKGSRWAYSSSSFRPATTTWTKPSVSAARSETQRDAHDNDAATQAKAERAQEFASHQRVLRRLRWKLPGLATSHRLAVDTDASHPHYSGVNDLVSLQSARAEAELMFKLDWFEYYALLERALLHLLGVWGIRVRRHGRADDTDEPASEAAGNNGARQDEADSIVGPLVYTSPYGHRFHANVLASLDMVTNPLHQTLGTGEARRALGAAKQLRNLWKDADERLESEAPLSSYDVEGMLAAIFAGFEAAFGLAEQAVEHDAQIAMDIDVDDWMSAS